MIEKDPTSGAARHLLPRGEKGDNVINSPSPLVGEGGRELARPEEGASVQFARHLRKHMTDAERRLWSALRAKRFDEFKFRRQVPVANYIADFLCFDRRLIVEVDGGQHSGSARDLARDAWFKSEGFRTLRFWNVDVFQALDGTLLAILDALNEAPSSGASRHLLPQGEKVEGKNHDP